MDKLKLMIKEIVKFGNLEGNEACEYYDRLTKNIWKDNSLELYEDSLDKDEFVAHNTILVVFTDMDKERETQIKKEGRKAMKKIVETSQERGIGSSSKKAEKPFTDMKKKELQDLITKKGLTFKKRDTNASLIKTLEEASIPVMADSKKTAKKNTPSKHGSKTEEQKIGHDSMLKVKEPTSSEKVKEKDLCTLVTEALTVKTNTLLMVMESVMIMSKRLRTAGLGITLIEQIKGVMPKEFDIWMVRNRAILKEKDRKLTSITKVSSRKKDKENTKSDKTGKKKDVVDVDAETILKKLKHKKLTEKILKDIPWKILKKLAKQRGVESFGKSKKFITKRLLKRSSSTTFLL